MSGGNPKATTWDFLFVWFFFIIIIIINFYYLHIFFYYYYYYILISTHNYMNCNKSAQFYPATTILGHTLVTLCNKGHYEGAQVHLVFLTGAQQAH